MNELFSKAFTSTEQFNERVAFASDMFDIIKMNGYEIIYDREYRAWWCRKGKHVLACYESSSSTFYDISRAYRRYVRSWDDTVRNFHEYVVDTFGRVEHEYRGV